MTKKSFLAELKVLLHANLEPAEAKDAYGYYCELFEEEPEDELIPRLESPQSVIEELLSQKERARHTIRGGFTALLLSLKTPHYRLKAAAAMIAVLLAVILLAALMLLTVWDAAAVITFRYLWTLWLLRDLTLMSLITLLMMMSLRHLPYIIFRRRKNNEKNA